jgi:hypothetical protein
MLELPKQVTLARRDLFLGQRLVSLTQPLGDARAQGMAESRWLLLRPHVHVLLMFGRRRSSGFQWANSIGMIHVLSRQESEGLQHVLGEKIRAHENERDTRKQGKKCGAHD